MKNELKPKLDAFFFALFMWFSYLLGLSVAYSLTKNSFVVSLIGTIFVLIAAFVKERNNFITFFSFKDNEFLKKIKVLYKILFVIILGITYQFIVQGFIQLVQIVSSNKVTQQGVIEDYINLNLFSKILFAIVVSVLVPMAEEIIFRKYLLDFLKMVSSNYFIVSISNGIIFALAHFLLDRKAPIVLLPLTIFGFISCYLVKKTDSIFYSLLFHLGFNIVAALILL